MPIFINSNISRAVSKTMQVIENPNRPWGVLVEEIPSDVGRTYQSYKRGGFLEGIERLTRETLSAGVWLFGIPIFNGLGNKFFENVLNVPMNMDYAPDTINDVANFLVKGKNKKGKSISELSKYFFKDFKLNTLNKTDEQLVSALANKIKVCKTISTVSAVLLNCLMMGVVIPKFNQSLTRKRLDKIRNKKTAIKNASFDDFKNKTSKNQGLSFKGGISNFIRSIPYRTENVNTFRLVVTDVPTLAGRTATSRNKYEALENFIIDGGSIYFYNFCAHNLRDFLCSKTKVPVINPMVYHTFLEADENTVKGAMDKVTRENKTLVSEMFTKEKADEIYDLSTFGKYTKLNRHVRPKDKAIIDNQVRNFISKMAEKTGYSKNGTLDMSNFKNLTKLYNIKSAIYLGFGFVVAILGLSTILPKLAFKITTLLTGKNEFTGIAHFDKKKDNVTKS